VPYAENGHRLVIAHSPLARGFLSGRYNATDRPRNRLRADARLFQPESFVRAEQLLGALREIAVARDATPAQVALAWTIRHPNVVAIPGASSVAQLESNAAAADIELAANEVEALDLAADSVAVRP
jgi:aryl-alcohol dehydrogenase-like predicted oxidoreductase